MSIRLKLTTIFLAIAIIPLLITGFLTFSSYKKSIESSQLSYLKTIAAFKADKIEAYFTGITAEAEIVRSSHIVREDLPVLIQFADKTDDSNFTDSQNNLEQNLNQIAAIYNLSDILLLNPQGRIIYANKPAHYSTDIFTDFTEAEQTAFLQNQDRIRISGIYFDKAEDNRFEVLISAPVYDFNDVFVGFVVCEVDMTSIYTLIQDTTGLGSTGETLLGKKSGNQVIFLNPLIYDPNAALQRKINIGDRTAFPVQEAAQGSNGAGQYLDYRDKEVIAAWRYIPSLDWGLVAKMDAQEAFADVLNLRNSIIILFFIIVALSSIISLFTAHSISEPIKQLSKGAEIIGSGNLDYEIGINMKNEIGQLSKAFDKMTLDLKKTTASREELRSEIRQRQQAEDELRQIKQELEIRVNERTAELNRTVSSLKQEVQQRERAEQVIKKERKRFVDVLNMLPAYAILLTPDYHVAYANRFFEERFGKDLGRRCYEYLFNRTEPCENCHTFKTLETGTSQRWEWTGPDGRIYDVFDYPFADVDGSPLIMEIGVDVTEYKKAHRELQRSREKLRLLTAELQLTEERERRKIAGDLHDSIGQILAFSSRELMMLQQTSPQKISKSLREIASQLDEAVKQVRTLSFDLSPNILYDLGFEVAIEDLMEKICKQRKIKCNFINCPDSKPMKDHVKILLYRSVRELLINIAKHADADRVTVKLERIDSNLHINIEDNGSGFDVSQLDSTTGHMLGFGIFSIREHLKHIGGKLEIDSVMDKGTKVSLIVPLNIENNI